MTSLNTVFICVMLGLVFDCIAYIPPRIQKDGLVVTEVAAPTEANHAARKVDIDTLAAKTAGICAAVPVTTTADINCIRYDDGVKECTIRCTEPSTLVGDSTFHCTEQDGWSPLPTCQQFGPTYLDGCGINTNTVLMSPGAITDPRIDMTFNLARGHGIKKLESVRNTIAALDSENQIWIWGAPEFGMFSTATSTPSIFIPPVAIVNIKACYLSFMLFTDNMDVYLTSYCNYKECFNGDNIAHYAVPTQIHPPSGRTIVDAFPGAHVNAMLLDDGAIYACGYSSHGSVGVILDRSPPVSKFLPSGTPDKIHVGQRNVAVVSTDKRVFVRGSNSLGELCMPLTSTTMVEFFEVSGLSNVISAMCTNEACFFVMESGKVFACGSNEDLETAEHQITPLDISEKFKTEDGTNCPISSFKYHGYSTVSTTSAKTGSACDKPGIYVRFDSQHSNHTMVADMALSRDSSIILTKHRPQP